jgi:hypothetical protein
MRHVVGKNVWLSDDRKLASAQCVMAEENARQEKSGPKPKKNPVYHAPLFARAKGPNFVKNPGPNPHARELVLLATFVGCF